MKIFDFLKEIEIFDLLKSTSKLSELEELKNNISNYIEERIERYREELRKENLKQLNHRLKTNKANLDKARNNKEYKSCLHEIKIVEEIIIEKKLEIKAK